MTLDTALLHRFKELDAEPPPDIFNAIRFEMVKHKRVLIIWNIDVHTHQVDIMDDKELWQPLINGRFG